MTKKTPLLTVRSQFSSLLATLESLGATLVGTAALTFIGGTIFLALAALTGLSKIISGGSIYMTLAVLGIVVLPPIYYEIKRGAYRRTIYNFYDDYLEFQHFQFLVNRRVGRIGYREITSVAEHANFVQEHEKLTTVYLVVPSMRYQSRGAFSGIKISDVARAEQLTGKILDLIDQSHSRVQSPAVSA